MNDSVRRGFLVSGVSSVSGGKAASMALKPSAAFFRLRFPIAPSPRPWYVAPSCNQLHAQPSSKHSLQRPNWRRFGLYVLQARARAILDLIGLKPQPLVRNTCPKKPIDASKRDAKDGEIGIVGYEIPFNRHFYQYQPPRPLEEIDADLDAVSAEIMALLREVHS